jgi:5-methylcytosine-specific restriction endonuclease McrBC regulatory subunit McrC
VALTVADTEPQGGPGTAAVLEARENEWFSLRPLVSGELTAERERWYREEFRVLSERLKRDLTLRQTPLAFDLVGGEPRLRVSGIAGTLNLRRGITVQVSPKFAQVTGGAGAWEESILTMLERVRKRQYVHARSRRLSTRPATFLDHMALAYVDALTDAMREDPIRTYVVREEVAPFLRGQFAVERQIASLLDRPGRIHCNVDYLETNNVFNHLLHWAVRRFEALAFDPQVRRLAASMAPRLPPIIGPPQLTSHLPLLPPAQYPHFGDALDIASTLARGVAHSQARGRVRGYGYLINMEQLFEKFVERSLAHIVISLGPTFSVVAQEARRYARAITDTRSYYTRPDNVIYKDAAPRMLVDAKYKRLEEADEGTPTRPNNSDVYQLYASMIAHGVKLGLLVYPRVISEGIVRGRSPLQVWEVGHPPSNGVITAVSLDLGGLRARAQLLEFDRSFVTTLEAVLTGAD